MIDACQAAIGNRKAERRFCRDAQSCAKCRPDRPAMGHADDIAPAMTLRQGRDRRFDPRTQIRETLPARGALVGWTEPITGCALRAPGEEALSGQALPVA